MKNIYAESKNMLVGQKGVLNAGNKTESGFLFYWWRHSPITVWSALDFSG
jgi:hypothetical protein